MRSHLFYWSPCMYAPISIHNEMVANGAKTLLTVPTVYVFCCEVFTFRSGCAMHNYYINFSHNMHELAVMAQSIDEMKVNIA